MEVITFTKVPWGHYSKRLLSKMNSSIEMNLLNKTIGISRTACLIDVFRINVNRKLRLAHLVFELHVTMWKYQTPSVRCDRSCCKGFWEFDNYQISKYFSIRPKYFKLAFLLLLWFFFIRHKMLHNILINQFCIINCANFQTMYFLNHTNIYNNSPNNRFEIDEYIILPVKF